MDGADCTRRIEELESYLESAYAHSEATSQRLERELHGRTGQRLVALALELRLLEAASPADSPERQSLALVIGRLTDIAADLRSIEQGVFPAILSDAGIPAGLRSLSRRATVLVDIRTADGPRLPPAIELAVYRAASAAIDYFTEIGAKRIGISATVAEPPLRLMIESDATDAAADPFGLVVRGQIDAAGGRTVVERLPGGATAVVVTFDGSREPRSGNGG